MSKIELFEARVRKLEWSPVSVKDADWNDLDFAIKIWGLIVGLNNGTDLVMRKTISSFLVEYYPSITAKELFEAFRLYAAQKLDFKDSVYDNMNPTFIGKVLNSYKEYCRKRNIIKVTSHSEPQKALEAPKLDPEQEGKRAFQFIKDNWKEGDIRPYNWTDAFKWLKLDLSENDKEKLKKQVLKNIAIEKQKRKERRTSYADLEDVSHKRNEYYKLAVLKVIKAYRAKT